ncbi:MAG: hypothetical protein WEA56_06155 [Balneolaceae bacterium]
MARGFKYFFIALIILIAAGFAILTLYIDSIVKSGMEDIGTEMTGTRVTVESVSISPFSGEGTVTGFRVANPDGYQTEHALSVDDFAISVDVTTLFSDVIVVNDIRVAGPAVYVEQKLPENNLQTILSNINEAVSTGTSTDVELVIDHFLLENGSADLYTEVGGERSASVEISAIELNDLGRGGERQAVEDVVQEIARRVIEEALQAAVQSGGQQLRDAIEDIFN